MWWSGLAVMIRSHVCRHHPLRCWSAARVQTCHDILINITMRRQDFTQFNHRCCIGWVEFIMSFNTARHNNRPKFQSSSMCAISTVNWQEFYAGPGGYNYGVTCRAKSNYWRCWCSSLLISACSVDALCQAGGLGGWTLSSARVQAWRESEQDVAPGSAGWGIRGLAGVPCGPLALFGASLGADSPETSGARATAAHEPQRRAAHLFHT